MTDHSPTTIEMQAVASQMHEVRLPPDLNWQDRFNYQIQMEHWKGIPLKAWPFYLMRAVWYLNLDPDHSFNLGFVQVRWVIDQLQTIHSDGIGFDLSEYDVSYHWAVVEADRTPWSFENRETFLQRFETLPDELPLPTSEDLAGLREQLAEVDDSIQEYLVRDQQEVEQEILNEDTDNLVADFGDVAMDGGDEEMQDVDPTLAETGATYTSIAEAGDVTNDDEDDAYISDLRDRRQKLVALLGAHITPPTHFQAPPVDDNLNEAFHNMELDSTMHTDASQSNQDFDLSALEHSLNSIQGEPRPDIPSFHLAYPSQ